jgi:hypothetical protein
MELTESQNQAKAEMTPQGYSEQSDEWALWSGDPALDLAPPVTPGGLSRGIEPL